MAKNSTTLISDSTVVNAPSNVVSNTAANTSEYVNYVKRQSVRGAASYFLRTLLLQGMNVVTMLLLTALLDPTEFGVYGIVVQIIAILGVFTNIGLAAALIQIKGKPTKQDYATAFALQQILSWVIFAICLAIAASGVLTQKTGSSAANYILLSLGISFVIGSFRTIPAVQLERDLQFSKLVIPQIFEQVVFNILIVYLAWKGFGALSYAPSIFIRSIVGVTVMYLVKPWLPQIGIYRSSIKRLLSFGVKFQLNDILALIKDNVFYLFLGFYFPLKEFGMVHWAKGWAMLPYNLTVQNVLAITFPTFSRLQGHTHLLKRAIEKSLFFISLVIFPILVGMSVFIYPLIMIIPRYNKWEPAVLSVVLFTLSILGSSLSTPLTNALNAIGKISTTLKLMILWTTLTWILTPLLVLKMGYNGVALSALIISLTSIIPFWLVKKYVPIEPWDQVWRQFLAASAMGLVGVLGMNYWTSNLAMMLTGMMITGSIYVLLIGLTGFKKLKFEIGSILQHRK